MKKTQTTTGNFPKLKFDNRDELKKWIIENDLKGIFATVAFSVNYQTLEAVY